MANRAVEKGIKKARRSFFHHGAIGVFQGGLSPLSSHAVVESCVMPVLLYSCENWIFDRAANLPFGNFPGRIGKKDPEATEVGFHAIRQAFGTRKF